MFFSFQTTSPKNYYKVALIIEEKKYTYGKLLEKNRPLGGKAKNPLRREEKTHSHLFG